MYQQTMNDLFFNAYIECAIWSSTHDDGRPLDEDDYSIESFDEDSLNKLRAHAIGFFDENIDLINEAKDFTYAEAGHDLWLTENGHGAGFWDRGLGDVGDKLTEKAQHHEQHIYVGDDGKLYI